MPYKIVWKVNSKRVPHYMDKTFPSRLSAKLALSKNVSGSKMGIRKIGRKK
jgi:hypothetical protein